MNIQVLVASMNQTDFSLHKKMNIQSDAIIVNQCDRNEFEQFDYLENKIRYLSFAERGVGLSRNTALMRATSDVVLFADEDMQYVDGYPELIINEFNSNPKADVIIFSLESLNHERPLQSIKKRKRVSRINALKYGCVRIAVRREKLLLRNIWFSPLFGGGAKFGSGEDTIFLQDCIKSKLKVYKSPIKIADVEQKTSSWFEGFNNKYFYDKGVLASTIMPLLCWPYAFIFAFKYKHSNSGELTFKSALKLMLNGIKYEKSL